METLEQVYYKTLENWSDWLAQHYSGSLGIWVVFYKKHTKVPCISYNDALEEALCFGWIDSLLRRIDDDRYVRKFTPR